MKPKTAPQKAPKKVTLYPYLFHTVDSSNFAALEYPRTPVIVVRKIIIAPIIPPEIPDINGFIREYSTIYN